jgi:nicotinamidase-related amidase
VSRTALIVIDMINSYDFPDAEKLIPSVEQALPAMREAIERARREDVLTVYVNDNYGKWRSTARTATWSSRSRRTRTRCS